MTVVKVSPVFGIIYYILSSMSASQNGANRENNTGGNLQDWRSGNVFGEKVALFGNTAVMQHGSFELQRFHGKHDCKCDVENS